LPHSRILALLESGCIRLHNNKIIVPPLQPAQLKLSADGVPWSDTYGDIYHSAAGALAQARHVFLAGNDLPQRWQGREHFVILETGFGLGNNFLATWEAWQTDPDRCGRLHFISVEKHPFSAEDLTRAHALSQVPASLSAELVAQWPLPLPGCHRLDLDGGRVLLTLFFGDIEPMLRQVGAMPDAIFLDGFAPKLNPEMWSREVFRALAALSTDATTLATWSVSAGVREGLIDAGFAVEKAEGFSGKREMLRGRCSRQHRTRPTRSSDRHVLVIGAGLAGTAVAERLVAHGYTVEMLEAHAEAAQGASGNLAGAFRPLPSLDDNLMARITRAGFLYALRHIQTLINTGHEVLWDACGVLHLARSADQERKQQRVVEELGAPGEFLDWVDAARASELAGHTAAFGGWWFPRGGWIQPGSLCAAHLAAGASGITLRTSVSVASIHHADGLWHALDEADQSIASAPQLVLANAHDARRLAQADWLPLQGVRGQVSHLPMAQLAPLGVVVCGQGYITPGIGGNASLGASFVADDFEITVREEEHAENIAKLERMLPEMAGMLNQHTFEGRVSWRPVSGDRLPMVGQLPAGESAGNFSLNTLPRKDGLWLITGFGARGLVWSSLCAELLAAKMCGEPLPMERELAEALDPARFVVRG
jgi:tRNA 5-methylaminomethyl-2-thiouridine biosynthesis bifunctional protein